MYLLCYYAMISSIIIWANLFVLSSLYDLQNMVNLLSTNTENLTYTLLAKRTCTPSKCFQLTHSLRFLSIKGMNKWTILISKCISSDTFGVFMTLINDEL